MTPHPRRLIALAVAGLTLLTTSACGAGGEAATDPAATASGDAAAPGETAAPNVAPPASGDPDAPASTTQSSTPPSSRTPKPPRRSRTTTTSAPPTTVAPTTTTTVELPRPIAPPLDDEAPEPVVGLGRLAIPALGLDRPLFEGIRLPTFDLGPGHWPGTAMPGQIGNMVIGGHRTNMNADFRYIDQLQPGNEMLITTNEGATFRYLVDSVEITDPYAQRVVAQTPAKTATLFACHPPGSVSQRIVVHLTLAP